MLTSSNTHYSNNRIINNDDNNAPTKLEKFMVFSFSFFFRSRCRREKMKKRKKRLFKYNLQIKLFEIATIQKTLNIN